MLLVFSLPHQHAKTKQSDARVALRFSSLIWCFIFSLSIRQSPSTARAMEGCGIGRGGFHFHFHFPLVVAAACLLLLLPPPAHAKPEAVEYCDKKVDYAVKVTGVEITPDPVVRGKPATFRISATTGVSISKGKLVVDVKYFGIHIHKETHDLCKETSCPVPVGDFMLSHDEILPSYAPPGSYTLIMRMIGENGSQLTCINFDFIIGFMSQVADN